MTPYKKVKIYLHDPLQKSENIFAWHPSKKWKYIYKTPYNKKNKLHDTLQKEKQIAWPLKKVKIYLHDPLQKEKQIAWPPTKKLNSTFG